MISTSLVEPVWGHTVKVELSHKYKFPSQNWNFLSAIQGKVIQRYWQLNSSLGERIMDQTVSKRIMIVGKDSHFSYLIQHFITATTHRVIPVKLSDDVLNLARYENPAVIVLEVDTPETEGWHVLRTLKADPAAGRIPVIVCSWLDESARGLAEGAAIYLRMPLFHSEFGAALQAVFSDADSQAHS